MTTYVNTHPRARKPHRCGLCGRTIRPGETYARGAGMDGGTAWTWKECAHCEPLVQLLGGPVYDLLDDDYDQSTVRDWEPKTLAHLRLKVGWWRKWTRRDGSLYPPLRPGRHPNSQGFSYAIDVQIGDPE